MCPDHIRDETESRLAHEGEPGLGFSLYFLERVATDEKMRDQGLERIARPDEVTAFLRRVEGAAYKRAAGAHGPRPGIDELPEAPVDASLETVQPPLLHQSQAELAEAEPRLVIAELQSQDCAEPDIGEARAVAVAMLQAEVRHAADDEAKQVLVSKQGGAYDRREHVHGGAPGRITHGGKIDEFLDRAAPELPPNVGKFRRYLFLRRMGRPVDAAIQRGTEFWLVQ